MAPPLIILLNFTFTTGVSYFGEELELYVFKRTIVLKGLVFNLETDLLPVK